MKRARDMNPQGDVPCARSRLAIQDILVFAALIFCYIYSYPYFRELRNPNELLHIYTARALIEQGTFSLDSYARQYGKRTDLSKEGDRIYSNKPPALALCAAGLYGWLRAAGIEPDTRSLTWIFRFAFAILPSLAFVLVLWRFLGLFELEGRQKRILILGYALGTPAFTYGILFYTHQPASVLLFAGFISAFHARTAGGFYYALSGFLCALAVACEYPSGLLFVLIFLYVLLGNGRLRGALLFAAAAAPVVLGLALYQHAIFGSPFTTPYAHMEDRGQAALFGRGFMGITFPRLKAIYGTLISPHRGLLFYSPFLLAGFAGFYCWWKRRALRAELLLCAAACVALLLFNFSYINWAAGWSLGPRHIISVYPFLVIGAGAFLAFSGPQRSPAVRAIFNGLVALSILVTALSTVVFANLPPAYKNPFFEMVIPLLRKGFFPYTSLSFLGIHGTIAALPLLAILALLLGYVLYTRGETWRKTLTLTSLATGLLLLSLFLMSLPGGSVPKEKERQDYLIEKMWEPAALRHAGKSRH